MLEFLQYDFMVRALLAGIIISPVLALLSVRIVLRNMSFIGIGISHSAFGGIAIGAAAGLDLTFSALLYSVAVALLIGLLAKKSNLREDTVIGIVFSVSMALGVVALGLSGVTIDLFSYLFGSILGIEENELWLLGGTSVAPVAIFWLFYREYFSICFDEEWARVSGIRIDLLNYLFLALIAMVVVVSIKLVGIILVSALLVIPGATGILWGKSLRSVDLIAMGSTVISVIGGLMTSYYLDVASGAAIVILASAIFMLAMLMGKLRAN